MSGPSLVVAGKTTMAVDGARAVRAAADRRGLTDAVLIVANRTDSGDDDWQPSLRRFAAHEPGFELIEFDEVYGLPELHFFSLEFDRLVRVDRTASDSLFNIHFSLLPAYKGMSTSVWPILEGRTESGVTLRKIDHGIDTGAIIDQRHFLIGPDDTARDLYLRYIEHGTELFRAAIDSLLDGTYVTRQQPAEGSSYRGRTELNYADPLPTFARTAVELRDRIRAFTFPEYQSVVVDGLAITHVDITDTPSTERAGAILRREPGGCRIATIDYDLELFGTESRSVLPG